MGKRTLDDTISQDLAPQVHEAFSRLSRRLRALDLPDGLTIERLSTLATVATLEPVSISALAKAEIVSLPTMSNMIAKLEAVGLVKRVEDKLDARGVLVSTTAKGRAIYQRATQQSLSHLNRSKSAASSCSPLISATPMTRRPCSRPTTTRLRPRPQ